MEENTRTQEWDLIHTWSVWHSYSAGVLCVIPHLLLLICRPPLGQPQFVCGHNDSLNSAPGGILLPCAETDQLVSESQLNEISEQNVNAQFTLEQDST